MSSAITQEASLVGHIKSKENLSGVMSVPKVYYEGASTGQQTINDIAGIYSIDWTEDGYISKDDGSVNSEAGSSYSDFLKIEPNGTLVISNTMIMDHEWNVWYDSDKNFISSFSNVTGTVTAPSNARYFRLSKKTAATLTIIHGNINSRIDENSLTDGDVLDCLIAADMLSAVQTVDAKILTDETNKILLM